MRLIKNNLLLLRPELLIYCSQKNEDNTDGDLLEMGKKHQYDGPGLAEECPFLIQDSLINAILIKSMVAIASPAPFTIQPTLPSRST